MSSGDAIRLIQQMERRIAKLEAQLVRPRFSGARVYNSGSLSIANATSTPLTFNSEFYDTDNYHDNVTNSDRLTVPSPGFYRLIGQVRFAGNATGFRQITIDIDGTTQIAAVTLPGSSLSDQMMIVTTEWEFSLAGQYARLSAYQNSGASLIVNTGAGGAFSPVFSIARLG